MESSENRKFWCLNTNLKKKKKYKYKYESYKVIKRYSHSLDETL